MIDPERREMFVDLYRLAEYYEKPPFIDGDIDGNAAWFEKAQQELIILFHKKHPYTLATRLAVAIIDEANELAKEANKRGGAGST